ncbi:tail fiber assembly protein [Pantoea rwandensis]|uniref:Phage tail protein n=1 Tax=Pantoea rwandensis TaxID=1076550 RepID=A0A1X1CP89_9GAMM|nr:tail fiber assembly protein [Pantoea rwandensis]ORM66137.1 hypothetical protein HA51_24175 [Pantoea rwandensis]
MKYTLKDGFRGFYFMDTESSEASTLEQTGLSISDFVEITDENYQAWCNPPEGHYAVFDESGPRVEKNPEPDYKEMASYERQSLLSSATQAITVWQTKLLMGRKLSDAETESLNAWLDYIDVLNDTDISDAPDVQWPTKPTA